MTRAATRSIDAQYYIWEGDLSGRMLLRELVAAADRGVRVRILIDDNPTAGLDEMWAAIDSHRNISVRLFNPLVIRRFRSLNYLFDFFRLNRRMHNKSMTFDGAVAILGGRNIGDAYFGAGDHGLFIDLDTYVVGPVVGDVAAQFERYWNSDPAYPVGSIVEASREPDLTTWREPQFENAGLAAAYEEAANEVIERRFSEGAGEAQLECLPARLVADNPDKALDKASRTDLLATRIAPMIEGARKRLDLISGYFVPGHQGLAMLRGLADRGVATRVVTNSFAVTDVKLVHAGYSPSRKPLLRAGIHLFETKPISPSRREKRGGSLRFSGGGESLHAKTFAIDDRSVFIGSFNFDPRSALLNCEMGLIVESESLATRVRQVLDERLPVQAYRLSLTEDGGLSWSATEGENHWPMRAEPGMTIIEVAIVRFLGILPIRWLL